MKQVYIYVLFSISFAYTYSQNTNSNYEQWLSLLIKGDNALKAQQTDSAKIYYLKAKDFSAIHLRDHPAYMYSLDRLISNAKPLQLQNYTSNYLAEVQNRTQTIFGNAHPFSTYVSDSLVDLVAYMSGNKNLANTYYYKLDGFFEKTDKTDISIVPFAKELALNSFMTNQNQNGQYFFQYWKPHKNTGYEEYKNIHLICNLNEANTRFEENEPKEALTYLIRAYTIMETDSSLEDLYGFDIRDKLFHYYRDTKEYDLATYYGLNLDDYYKTNFGEISSDYVYILNEIGIAHYMQKNNEYANVYFNLAMQIILTNLDKEFTAYHAVKDNYINSLQIQNKPDDILAFYKKEILLYEANKIYNTNYLKALKDYKQIASNRNDNIEHTRILNLEIEYYELKNLYESDFITAIFELAGLYLYNSENYVATQIIDKHRTKLELALKNSDYNVGEFYRSMAVFENSRTNRDQEETNKRILDYCNKAISHFKKNNTNYTYYANLMIVRALAIWALEGNSKGLDAFYSHKQQLENLGQTKTEDYASMLYLMTELTEGPDKNEQDLELIASAMAIYKELNLTASTNYNTIRSKYGTLLVQADKATDAVPYYLETYDFHINKLESEAVIKSSTAQEFKINQTVLDFFSEIQFVNYLLKNANNDLSKKAIEASLLTKNLTLNISGNILNQLRNLENDYVTKRIEVYTELAYLQLYLMDVLNKKGDEESLKEIQGHEKQLNESYAELISSYFENHSEKLITPINHDDFKLGVNSIFIDYSRIKDTENKYSYLAYIYSNKWSQPQIVFIATEESINSILQQGNLKNLSYNTRGSEGTNINNASIGKELYSLLWKPLLPYVENSLEINFSLSGVLNKIPMATLQDEDGKLLLEKFKLHQLSNASSLLSTTKVEPVFQNSTIYGGINYDTQYTLNLKNSFGYLPGTKQEAFAIKSIIPTATIITEKNASETNFRNLTGKSPSVLHLATHGFYFDYNKNPEGAFGSNFKTATNPLKRTGLLLADGNEGINSIYQSGQEQQTDGVLTSLEIAYMDLRETDLVVLSACETGLGDIDGAEGVFGLQRAFKMAGVDLLLMSLWEIPDDETKEFMTYFYQESLSQKDVRQSFRNTQLHMKNLYQDQPEKWAAFILVE